MSWGLSQLTVHSCSSRFTHFQFQIDSSARHLLRKIFSLFLPSQVTVTEVYRESFTMAGPAARLAALQRHLGAASLEMEPSVQQQQCKAAGATGFARKGIAAPPSVCSARYPLEFLPAPSITCSACLCRKLFRKWPNAIMPAGRSLLLAYPANSACASIAAASRGWRPRGTLVPPSPWFCRWIRSPGT